MALQVDLPFTTFGKAMASRNAIQAWIRENILDEALEYIKTREIPSGARRGILHSFLDVQSSDSVDDPATAQIIAV